MALDRSQVKRGKVKAVGKADGKLKLDMANMYHSSCVKNNSEINLLKLSHARVIPSVKPGVLRA